MPEPRSLEDLVFHRYHIESSPEELRMLPDAGEAEFHHQRDLLKARLAAHLNELTEDRVARMSRDEASWCLAVLGEMVFECRHHSHWGGAVALPRLETMRGALAKRVRG